MLPLRSNSYANAKGWDNLTHVFTESLRNSSLDEMILLVHTATPSPYGWPPKYVRLVSYNKLEEVPKLLLSAAPSGLRSGAISVRQERPHVEVGTGIQPNGDREEQGQHKRVEMVQERITDETEAEAVTSGGDHEEEIDETRVNAAKMIQHVYRRHLEKKRAGAARKIQAAYRRRLKRKSVVRKGVDATQAHYWDLLRKRSLEMEWSKGSQYYLLFRVPLAYVLVCLDAIGAFVEAEKKEAKKRVMNEDDKDLEQLMETLDQHRCDSVDCTLY